MSRWRVPSFTDPKVVYVVDIAQGTCSCPAWRHSHQDCKHLRTLSAIFHAQERVDMAMVLGVSAIPPGAAEVIVRALDRMEARGEITDRNRWQGLEYMAADYLAGA